MKHYRGMVLKLWTAQWYPASSILQAALEDLVEDLQGVDVLVRQVDDHPADSESDRVVTVPTLVVTDDTGTELKRFTGAINIAEVKTLTESH